MARSLDELKRPANLGARAVAHRGSSPSGGARLRVLEGGRAAAAPASTRARPAAGARVAPSAAVASEGARDARRLAALVGVLSIFGIIVIAAVSPIQEAQSGASPFALVERQVLWAGLGAIGFIVAARIELHRLRRLVTVMLVLVTVALVAVLIPHLGKGAGGSSRWLGFGPITVQPSELAKLVFVVFAADLVARREALGDHFNQLVRPLGLVLCFLAILILKQPDMGTAMVLVAIAAAMWYAGGVRGRLLGAVSAGLLAVGSAVAFAAPYRRARLLSFFNPFGHASTSGYQLVQSLAALGSGHLAGAPMSSALATWFLPNAESDFVFAAIGNDFGLFGTVAVLAAFGYFALLGARIAARASDRFASLLATAITCWLVFQAVVNIGGVLGVLPDTGIPLPFLSYGGSALIVALFGTGLLANISRHPAGPGSLPRDGAPRRQGAQGRPVRLPGGRPR